MKANQLIIACFSLLLVASCAATPAANQERPDYQAPTVAPEIAEAIPVDTPHSIAPTDSISPGTPDTLRVALAKDTLKKQQQTSTSTPKKDSDFSALKEIGPKTQQAAQTVKKEAQQAAKEIKQVAKETAQTIKKESAKATESVKKATKDLKQELKK